MPNIMNSVRITFRKTKICYVSSREGRRILDLNLETLQEEENTDNFGNREHMT